MQLPAAYADAKHEEMVCRTMNAIQAFRDDILLPTDREWMIALLRDRLRDGLTEQERMIAWARGGCVLSHEALLLEFRELANNHILAPASLNDYVGKPDLHPQRGKGADWWVNFRRNVMIAALVHVICEHYRITSTRSSASIGKKPCAAAVVAKALRRSGHKITEKTVANVCRSRPPLPPVWFVPIAGKLGCFIRSPTAGP